MFKILETRTSQITLCTGAEDEKDTLQTAYTFSGDENGILINSDGTCGSHCGSHCSHKCILHW
jgi:hypothetical protein